MITQIYASTATWLLSAAELHALLEQSRRNNTRLGITGMLLYKGGNFLQVLEGEADAVSTLSATILRDSRHHGMIVMLEQPIAAPRFPDWAMAFRDLNTPDIRATPGYSDFLNTPLTATAFGDNPGAVYQLLEMFKKTMR